MSLEIFFMQSLEIFFMDLGLLFTAATAFRHGQSLLCVNQPKEIRFFKKKFYF